MKMNLYRSGALCACMLLGLSAMAAEEQPAEKAPPAKKAAVKPKPKPEPAPMTLPSGAVQTAPGTYTYTDSQGKKWIYRKTPFGLARVEDQNKPATPAEQETREKSIAQTHAVADGDTIRFERPGPFGTYRWTKKTTETLSPIEQAVWERDRPATPAAGSKD